MTLQAKETLVGVFILAGLAALVWLTLFVGNWAALTGGAGYRVTAKFENIGGLTVKSPVTLAGVTIGRVASISSDREDYSAIVTLSIDQNYNNLPVDSTAAILTAGLLGAQYIGVVPGAEIDYLKEGDSIDITQSALVLEQLIGELLFSRAGAQ